MSSCNLSGGGRYEGCRGGESIRSEIEIPICSAMASIISNSTFFRPYRAWKFWDDEPRVSLADSLCPGLISFALSGLRLGSRLCLCVKNNSRGWRGSRLRLRCRGRRRRRGRVVAAVVGREFLRSGCGPFAQWLSTRLPTVPRSLMKCEEIFSRAARRRQLLLNK